MSTSPSAAPRRRGRRPGGADTRGALLEAARAAFVELGYDGATVRGIAERAGVDPAMVNHWFGSKEKLFVAAIQLPVDPSAVLEQVVPGDPEKLGERIIGAFLSVWDATGGGQLAALVQSITSHQEAAQMLRDLVSRVLVKRLIEAVAPDRTELRANLVGSQLIGLGMARYVVKLEPIASAAPAELVQAIGPTIQRYATGDIG
ncbi:transcriptional regulator, TetR family [Pseudonocardia thermophila]|uniref:Transcriptional regulator, TetR family n=1 Tax=Pseudonocardia thermophila TaxID=1848 RepID=A0A1M6VTG1_PSETH|nr:TetR family transcriptional regulator [Pseudonocardia thermophila]SHK84605.1 transcriptional regulator, TetR family [Pseudonocardia thermophila]